MSYWRTCIFYGWNVCIFSAFLKVSLDIPVCSASARKELVDAALNWSWNCSLSFLIYYSCVINFQFFTEPVSENFATTSSKYSGFYKQWSRSNITFLYVLCICLSINMQVFIIPTATNLSIKIPFRKSKHSSQKRIFTEISGVALTIHETWIQKILSFYHPHRSLEELFTWMKLNQFQCFSKSLVCHS